MGLLRCVFFILICFISFPVFSQVVLQGKVISLPGKQPVPFANIGIINSGVGSISNLDGSFLLRIPSGHPHDSIIFSALGFGRVFIPVSGLDEDVFYTVYLRQAPVKLNTVIIKGGSWEKKSYHLGNRKFEGTCVYADTLMAGSAIALLIRNPRVGEKNHFEYPVYIEEAQLLVAHNTFGPFRIRTRLYDVDPKSKKPGKDLLNESIITQTELENGLVKIDLRKYSIKVDGDFFLAFEWILDKTDRRNLFLQFEKFRQEHPELVNIEYSIIDGEKVPYLDYGGNFYAGPTVGVSVRKSSVQDFISYYRFNSFGKWYRSASIPAAMVVVSDTPGWKEQDFIPAGPGPDQEFILSYYKMRGGMSGIKGFEKEGKDEKIPILFGHRLTEPVLIEARRVENQIIFTAKNFSWYPYTLEMNFSKILNLSPLVTSKTFILNPGGNRLLTLTIADTELDHFHYELSVRETIGDTSHKAVTNYDYLLPIGGNRKVNKELKDLSNRSMDAFKIPPGDTVFIMRKGWVTALPLKQADRISVNESLEILHADGTVMVYENIDPSYFFVREGEEVYPGQPAGLIEDGKNLEVALYLMKENNRLEKIPIFYTVDGRHSVPYEDIKNGSISEYPESVMTREMDDRELARYRRNSLY